MILSVLKRADFLIGKAILKLSLNCRRLVLVYDDFVADIEIFGLEILPCTSAVQDTLQEPCCQEGLC